jgi:RNA polymerase sigma-70 factor (ECF subfamily)
MTSQKEISLKDTLATAYETFEKGLLVHAKFRISDPAMCDELVQDTFIKTWNYLLREGKIDLMKPFLYHILNCLIIDEYRRHKNFSLDRLISDGFDIRDDVIERHINELDGEALAKLITSLPAPYASMLQMRYIEDLTLKEIADKTGCTKNTAAVQVHRGLAKLRTLYLYKVTHTLAGL